MRSRGLQFTSKRLDEFNARNVNYYEQGFPDRSSSIKASEQADPSTFGLQPRWRSAVGIEDRPEEIGWSCKKAWRCRPARHLPHNQAPGSQGAYEITSYSVIHHRSPSSWCRSNSGYKGELQSRLTLKATA